MYTYVNVYIYTCLHMQSGPDARACIETLGIASLVEKGLVCPCDMTNSYRTWLIHISHDLCIQNMTLCIWNACVETLGINSPVFIWDEIIQTGHDLFFWDVTHVTYPYETWIVQTRHDSFIWDVTCSHKAWLIQWDVTRSPKTWLIHQLTEVIRLEIFGSRHLSVFPIDLLSDGDSVYSTEKAFEILGTPVKTCLIRMGSPVTTC